jgi:hypothetical protein
LVNGGKILAKLLSDKGFSLYMAAGDSFATFPPTPVGRMWNITIVPYGQVNLSGKIEEPLEVQIIVQPGAWTKYFLNLYLAPGNMNVNSLTK